MGSMNQSRITTASGETDEPSDLMMMMMMANGNNIEHTTRTGKPTNMLPRTGKPVNMPPRTGTFNFKVSPTKHQRNICSSSWATSTLSRDTIRLIGEM